MNTIGSILTLCSLIISLSLLCLFIGFRLGVIWSIKQYKRNHGRVWWTRRK